MSKFWYAIALILVLLVSACAAQPQKQPTADTQPAKQAPQPEAQPEKKAEVVASPPAEAPQEPVKPKSAEIRLLKKGVEPLELAISAGTSVTWINDGGIGTTITMHKDNKFFQNSPLVKKGEKFEYEFKEKGAYTYWGVAYGPVGAKITVN